MSYYSLIPQMSPMLWLNLYLYFVMNILIVMMMIWNMVLYKNSNIYLLNNYKINFYLLWY